MGVMLVPVLNWTPAVGVTVAMVCLTAFFAAVRSAGSSSLGLVQLPGNPGSMMGARTASAQLGYVLGAAGGGLVIELLGFGALGFVLLAGMAAVRPADAAGGRPGGGAGCPSGPLSGAGARLTRPLRRLTLVS